MTISVVLCHLRINDEIEAMFDRCLKSIRGKGYDELILNIGDTRGYSAAFDFGMKLTIGDYIICISDDVVLQEGSFKDMCNSKAVTFSSNIQFGALFCIPRWVYKSVGDFSTDYGFAYYEDSDYLLRLKEAKVPLKRVEDIKASHVGGATIKAMGRESESSEFGKRVFEKKWGSRDPNEGVNFPYVEEK